VIEIPVNLASRAYRIIVATGARADVGAQLAKLSVGRRVALLTDATVRRLHGEPVTRGLVAAGFEVTEVLLPEGEQAKTLDVLREVWDDLLEAGCDRTSTVVAVGGGAVGDLAGFAAATYMRGINFVQVPTTLLAQVDASSGGKTAIDHPRAKNLIGAFHQPRAVISDPSLLRTLPPRETQSGAYEVLKCAVLADPALFRALRDSPGQLQRWPEADVDRAIAAACRIKARIVAKDEREGGLRRVLNLGHTLGHALEAATGYARFTHGEAVGWGLIGASEIARRRGLLAEPAFQAIASAVDRLGPRPGLSRIAPQRILAALAHDKKAKAGRVPFILPTAIGRVAIHSDVSRAEVRSALRALAGRETPRGRG